MKKRGRIANFILALTVACSVIPAIPARTVEAGTSQEQRWQEISEILSEVTGRYTEAPDKSKVECSTFTAGMLLGNGSFGVVSDARENEQSFYFAGQDVWNGNQKVMNAQLQLTPLVSGELEVTANDTNAKDSPLGAGALVDGNLETWWISNAQSAVKGDKWVMFDFKKKVTIDAWSTVHRGYMDVDKNGNHNIRYNTRDFSLQTSEDGKNWTDVDIVTGNTEYELERELNQAVTSRYFRINITQAVQPGEETYSKNDPPLESEVGNRHTARLAEVDFTYQGSSVIEKNTTQALQLTYKNSDSEGWNADAKRAFDSDPGTLWRSNNQAERINGKTVPHDKWVQVSSNLPFSFDQIEMKLIGVLYPENSCYNLYQFEIQISDDGKSWTTIQSVNGNRDSTKSFSFPETKTAKYLRIYSTQPVAPEYASKHYANDMTNAYVTDVDLYYQGENVLNPKKESGSYYHEQDILNAEVRSCQEFGGSNVSFRSWTAEERNILYTDITLDEKETEAVELQGILTSPEGIAANKGNDGNTIWLTRESGGATAPGGDRNYISRSATAVRVLEGESRVEDGKLILKLEPGKTLRLVSYAHSSSGLTNGTGVAPKGMDQVRAEAIERLGKVTTGDMEREHQEHLAWWKDYWLKSYVKVDDTILQRYYMGALYGLGCTIRPTPEGAEQPNVPAGALGVWQTNDTCASSGRGYTNYNYESPYYGIYSSNRSQLMEPYYIDADVRLAEGQNNVARKGYRGAQFSRSIVPVYPFYYKKDPIAVSSTKDPATLPTDQKSNVMLFTQLLIWDWQYNRNEETLRTYIYPAVQKTVEFYMDFVVKEADGKYYVYNSANNETGGSGFDTNPILDLGYIQSHFRAFIEMSEYLGENQDMIPAMQEIMENLCEQPTSQNAEPARTELSDMGFDSEKEVYISAYSSHNATQTEASNCVWGSYIYEGNQPVALEAVVHPSENVSLASDPEKLKVARDTFEYFNPLYLWYRGAGYNGFAKSFTIAARLGIDGDYILDHLDKTIYAIWRENLTCNNGNAHGAETFGTIEAVNSMLLQHHEEELRVFPSWAKETSVKFVDLRAKGAFLVSSEYDATSKTIPYVDLTSEKGGTLHFVSPWENGAVIVDENGQQVEAEITQTKNTKELLYTFPTEAGKSYHMTESDTPYAPIESIEVTADRTVVYTNDTLQATAIVKPESDTVRVLNWSSSDPEVAQVDQNGLITGLKPGTAEITAASASNPKIAGSLRITVQDILPESVRITGYGDGILSVNDRLLLGAEVLPENAVNKEVSWSSSNPNVVSVDEFGNIKGLLSGTARVTAKARANEAASDTVELTVQVPDTGYEALRYYPGEANPGGGDSKKNWNMAYSFRVKSPILVTELGVYDKNGDGVFSHEGTQVAIYPKEDSTAIAFAEIAKDTPADGNGYCYMKLDQPVTLTEGEYEIVAFYPIGNVDSWFHSNGSKPFGEAPQIEYLYYGYINNKDTLQKVNASETSSGMPYFCMNFRFLDKNRLSGSLELTVGLREEDYSPESWAQLAGAIAAAEEALEDSCVSQNRVDGAEEALRRAMDALIPLDAAEEVVAQCPDIMEFDGTEAGTVTVPDGQKLRTLNAITVDFWFQCTQEITSTQVLLGKKAAGGNGFKLELSPEGVVRFVVRGTDGDIALETEENAVTFGQMLALAVGESLSGEEDTVNADDQASEGDDTELTVSLEAEGDGTELTASREAEGIGPELTVSREDGWHHVIAVYDPQQREMFLTVDGITKSLKSDQISRSTINAPDVPLTLGYELDENGAAAGFLVGRIARLAVTNTAADILPPEILTGSLPDGSTETALDVVLRFELSEEITVAADQIRLENGSELLEIEVTYENGILTIVPKALKGGTEYTLRLFKDALKDLAGNSMTEDYVITFTTEEEKEPENPNNPDDKNPTNPDDKDPVNPDDKNPTNPDNPDDKDPANPNNPDDKEPTNPDNSGGGKPENPGDQKPGGSDGTQNPGGSPNNGSAGGNLSNGTGKGKTPSTGDDSMANTWCVLAAGSAAVLIAAHVQRRKKEQR